MLPEKRPEDGFGVDKLKDTKLSILAPNVSIEDFKYNVLTWKDSEQGLVKVISSVGFSMMLDFS